MELKQLEAFVSVAEAGSFSDAARRMFLTQPTVSTHIAALEKELGVKLFERTTKSLSLTRDGRRLLEIASHMLELRDLMKEYSLGTGEKTIRIGASTIPSGYLLPKVTGKFLKKAKGMSVTVKYGNSLEIEEMVCDGKVGFGVIGKESTRPELSSELLCLDEMVVAMPNEARFIKLLNSKDGHEKILARLLQNPIILREEGSGTKYAARSIFERYETGSILMRSNDQEAIKKMVADGAGISLMSAFAAQDMVLSGSLLTFPIREEAPRSFNIIYKKNVQLKEEENDYIRMVKEFYSQDIYI